MRMTGRKVLSPASASYALILLGIAFIIYSQVFEFQKIQRFGEGIFTTDKPRRDFITTPTTMLTPGIRWNHMPLTVNVDLKSTPQGWTPAFLTSLDRAMNEIEAKTGGLVTFLKTPDSNADIRIRWVSQFSYSKTLDTIGHTELTYTSFDGRALIRKAEIEILTRADGRVLTEDEMQNTILHELGHALGLNHTDDPSSMMFPTANEKMLSPNPNDAETLRRVYIQEALADLFVSEAQASKKAQKGVLFSRYYLDGNVTVQNYGYLDTANVLLRIKADGRVVHEEILTMVEAGQSVQFAFKNLDAEGDFDSATFEVDPTDGIREYNENDNVATVFI